MKSSLDTFAKTGESSDCGTIVGSLGGVCLRGWAGQEIPGRYPYHLWFVHRFWLEQCGLISVRNVANRLFQSMVDQILRSGEKP